MWLGREKLVQSAALVKGRGGDLAAAFGAPRGSLARSWSPLAHFRGSGAAAAALGFRVASARCGAAGSHGLSAPRPRVPGCSHPGCLARQARVLAPALNRSFRTPWRVQRTSLMSAAVTVAASQRQSRCPGTTPQTKRVPLGTHHAGIESPALAFP